MVNDLIDYELIDEVQTVFVKQPNTRITYFFFVVAVLKLKWIQLTTMMICPIKDLWFQIDILRRRM